MPLFQQYDVGMLKWSYSYPEKVAELDLPIEIPEIDIAKEKEQAITTTIDCYVSGEYIDTRGRSVRFGMRFRVSIKYSYSTVRQLRTQLHKILANEFKVRIEMRQIGARQEAGRIGGIGACGRELCCSVYITNFVSVTTSSARFQEVSLNPQKLAGQCSKLKCCLNYELDVYLDAQKDFPDVSVPLETENGPAYHQKTDVFKRLMWYSFDKESASESACLAIDSVKEIIKMNKKGEKVKNLENYEYVKMAPVMDYHDRADEESLSRIEDQPKDSKNLKNIK